MHYFVIYPLNLNGLGGEFLSNFKNIDLISKILVVVIIIIMRYNELKQRKLN